MIYVSSSNIALLLALKFVYGGSFIVTPRDDDGSFSYRWQIVGKFAVPVYDLMKDQLRITRERAEEIFKPL